MQPNARPPVSGEPHTHTFRQPHIHTCIDCLAEWSSEPDHAPYTFWRASPPHGDCVGTHDPFTVCPRCDDGNSKDLHVPAMSGEPRRMRVGINGRHIHSAGVTDPERCKECRPPVSGEPPRLLGRMHQCPGCWSTGMFTIDRDWKCDCGEALTCIDLRAIEDEASTGAALDTLTGDAGDREWVNGHLYVHVAACPCPPMQAEVARLAEQEGEGR